MGIYEEGLIFLFRSLKILENIFGGSHPESVNALLLIGKFYIGNEKFEEAEKFLSLAY